MPSLSCVSAVPFRPPNVPTLEATPLPQPPAALQPAFCLGVVPLWAFRKWIIWQRTEMVGWHHPDPV